VKDQHLISVDELRAAGALDVPASWRKSLGGNREQMTLFGDDDAQPKKTQQPVEQDHDETSDDAS
jgi:hypothetical protein